MFVYIAVVELISAFHPLAAAVAFLGATVGTALPFLSSIDASNDITEIKKQVLEDTNNHPYAEAHVDSYFA